MSQPDHLEYIPSPPMTHYASSSYSVAHTSDSDSASRPPSEMGMSLLPSSLSSLRVSAERTPKTLATTNTLGMTESPSSVINNFNVMGAKKSTKRTFTDRMNSTPPVSPKKKKSKVSSAIRTALEHSPKGLLKFLKKCTPTERDEQVQRATEEENERWVGKDEEARLTKIHRDEKTREDDKIRQQRHRQKLRDEEISRGERTPGGSKRNQKVRVTHLHTLLHLSICLQRSMVHLDSMPSKRPKLSVAELSRPNRAESEHTRQKRRETQKRGRPRVLEHKNAVYHNWFSPFLWSQILLAGKAVGWQMSASAIRNSLQKKDPAVFGNISRTTINEWIDRSGDRPRWSENTLRLVEKGNHQRHPNGGHRGALVSDR